ncbi:MAG: hypothetical protein MUO68_15395 [Desulfobacteraceae bacterium]|nr:hypothetical protein [Desulfobacteraceae bacterium]
MKRKGWDKRFDWPTKEKLEALDLEKCIEMLQTAKGDLKAQIEKICA